MTSPVATLHVDDRLLSCFNTSASAGACRGAAMRPTPLPWSGQRRRRSCRKPWCARSASRLIRSSRSRIGFYGGMPQAGVMAAAGLYAHSLRRCWPASLPTSHVGHARTEHRPRQPALGVSRYRQCPSAAMVGRCAGDGICSFMASMPEMLMAGTCVSSSIPGSSPKEPGGNSQSDHRPWG